jgi:hypothetical protein
MAISTINSPYAITSPGSVLQVVQATTQTPVVVNTATWTDSTLSATITPKSASSKILVTFTQIFRIQNQNSGNYVAVGTQLLRNSTVIWYPVTDSTGPYNINLGSNTSNAPNARITLSQTYLDSPATTSAITYKTQGRRYDSTSFMTFQENDTVYNSMSVMILMEIAG